VKNFFSKFFLRSASATLLHDTNALRWEREDLVYPALFGCSQITKSAVPSKELLSLFFDDCEHFSDVVSVLIFPPCGQRNYWVHVTSGLTNIRRIDEHDANSKLTSLGFELFATSSMRCDYIVSMLLRLALYQISVAVGRIDGTIICGGDRIPLLGIGVQEFPQWAYSLVIHSLHEFPQGNSLGASEFDLYQVSAISKREHAWSDDVGLQALLGELKKNDLVSIERERESMAIAVDSTE